MQHKPEKTRLTCIAYVLITLLIYIYINTASPATYICLSLFSARHCMENKLVEEYGY